MEPRALLALLAGVEGQHLHDTGQADEHTTPVCARPLEHTDVLTIVAPEPVSPNDENTNIKELEEEISEIEDLEKKVEALEALQSDEEDE